MGVKHLKDPTRLHGHVLMLLVVLFVVGLVALKESAHLADTFDRSWRPDGFVTLRPVITSVENAAAPRFVTHFTYDTEAALERDGLDKDGVKRAMAHNVQLLARHGGLGVVVTPESREVLVGVVGAALVKSLHLVIIRQRSAGDSVTRVDVLAEISGKETLSTNQIVFMSPALLIIRSKFIRAMRFGYPRVAAFSGPPSEASHRDVNTFRPVVSLDLVVVDVTILGRYNVRESMRNCSLPEEECFSEWLHGLQRSVPNQVLFALMGRQFMCSKSHWSRGCLSYLGSDVPDDLIERRLRTANEPLVGLEQAPLDSLPLPQKALHFVTLFDYDDDQKAPELSRDPLLCKARALQKLQQPFTIFTSASSLPLLQSWSLPHASLVPVDLTRLPCNLPDPTGTHLCRKLQLLQSPSLHQLREFVYLDVDTHILSRAFVDSFLGWRHVAPFVAARAHSPKYHAQFAHEDYYNRSNGSFVWYNSGVFYLRVDALPGEFFRALGACTAKPRHGADQACLSEYMDGARGEEDVPDAVLPAQYHCRAFGGGDVPAHMRPCTLWHRWGEVPRQVGKCLS